MIRAAYWTCALVALAHARVYERCELARELTSLGVDHEDLSTWVCITFHESRFDTAAQNSYSGDHGLFQISELYWCGPGKACGLPCSALRDEDISDDLECALKIREEHDRLQGNGFLAWVVYPQHCKHNTKKYIVDCDSQLKNATLRTPSKSRSFSNPYIMNATKTSFEYNPNIDSLKPPYWLNVNSIVREGNKLLEDKKKENSAPKNWSSYKIDNIDELTLPLFDKQFDNFPRFTPTTTTTAAPTTSTTISTSYPPIKVWRRIETNQFRKKPVINKKPTPIKWLELGKPTSALDFIAPSTSVNGLLSAPVITTSSKPSTTEVSTTVSPSTARKTPISFIFTSPTIKSTTNTPFVFTTKINKPISTNFASGTPNKTSEKYEPFVFTTNTPKLTTKSATASREFNAFIFTRTTAKPTTNKAAAEISVNSRENKPETPKPFVFTTTTAKPTSTKINEALVFTNTREFKPFIFTSQKPTIRTTYRITDKSVSYNSPATTKRPATFKFTSRATPSPFKNKPTGIDQSVITKNNISPSPTPKTTTPFHFFPTTWKPPSSTTENRPKTAFNFLPLTTTTVKPTLATFTFRPLNITDAFKNARSSRTSKIFSDVNYIPSTNRPRASSFNSIATQRLPVTTPSSVRSILTQRLFMQRDKLTPVPGFSSVFTSKPVTNKVLPTTAAPPQNTATKRTTQSIFDLYLNPTQRPKLPIRRFSDLGSSAFKLKIFSGGTTPAPPT